MKDADPYGSGDYILDQQGNEGRSKIDVEALEGIAEELDVPFEHRDVDVDLEPAAVDASRGDGAEDRAGTTTFPLYWVPALGALAWMLAEVGLLAAELAALRRAREVIR